MGYGQPRSIKASDKRQPVWAKTNNIAEPHAEIHDRTPVSLITRNAFTRQSEAHKGGNREKNRLELFFVCSIHALSSACSRIVAETFRPPPT